MPAHPDNEGHTTMTDDSNRPALAAAPAALPTTPETSEAAAAADEAGSTCGASPAPTRTLAFSGWYPYFAGAVVGLLLRLVFVGQPGGAFSAMLGAFILLAPAVCGAVTVYAAERQRRRSGVYYFFAPWLSVAAMVTGALTLMIEGWICAIVIFPLFMLLGSVGGLIMGAVVRLTKWPRQVLYSFAALPLALGAVEPQFANPVALSSASHSVFIAAPPQRVWDALVNVPDIRAEELGEVWAYRIGVPRPLESLDEASAVTPDTPTGHIRRMQWARGVHFDGLVTTWEPGRALAWRYRFGPDAIPPGALDDHVRVGGSYFDLNNTRFTLTPRDGGTDLRIDVHWRTSTRFNWYADGVAHLLIGNFTAGILDFYKQRAERLAAGA
jgi:uncharacterized protein YndB with AHSA1/START domain